MSPSTLKPCAENAAVTPSRRTFFVHSIACAATVAFSATTQAQTQAAVAENDPQAMALGYKADGTKTDPKRYPNYAAGQSCAGCALFQGKATDSAGACAVFGGKWVAGKGWCSAHTKKG